MAASQPAYREPAALERTMSRHRLEGVLGAGGMEPAARWQDRRDEPLVTADENGETLTWNTRKRDHPRSPWPQHREPPGDELIAERIEAGPVGLAAGANDQVPRGLMGLKVDAPDFAEAPTETITGHRGRLKFRNDQSHPRVARRVVCPDHVQVLVTATPSFVQAAANVGRAGEPVGSRHARRSRQEPPCFDGSETVRSFRPFLRRRESVARPQRVAIRARKPCLLIRRLLRGR
jgi:hypothetical protein